MSKIIDITDKLNFEERPVFKIKDVEVTANNDAVTILKVIALFDGENGDVATDDILKVFDLLFDEKEQAKLRPLGLTFNDLATFISLVAEVIINGDEEDEGEAPTPATT